MSNLIFILMIALLPLQGWTSVAMSTEMATLQLASTLLRSGDTAMKMSPECALRMGAANSQSVKFDDMSTPVCSDCQACHLIALAEPLHVVIKMTFSVSFERSARHYFNSADVQFSQKPPIFSA